MRRGMRYPQWWMLLMAILAILSNQGSLLGMERFGKSQAQLDVEGFQRLLLQLVAPPWGTDTVETLVCNARTLRGSVAENASGAVCYGLRPTASTLTR